MRLGTILLAAWSALAPAPRAVSADAKADIEEVGRFAELLDEFPVDGWKRLRERRDAGKWTVEEADGERYRADLKAVRARCLEFSDPWWKEALGAVKAVREDPVFRKFLPVDVLAEPPWLVMAQHQADPMRQSTVNVLGNHAKILRCVHEAFRTLLVEAKLPDPTREEMGNPVLQVFVFTDRRNFNVWHTDQGIDPKSLASTRAYLRTDTPPRVFLYDTGASAELQNDDTGTAAQVGVLRVLREVRRAILDAEAHRKDPAASRVPLWDPQCCVQPLWLETGLVEAFGAADRVSSVTGEWKFLRPSHARLREWGDPVARGAAAQWTLEDLLAPTDWKAAGETIRTRWPGEEQGMQSLFAAQSWGLTHFLLNGKDGALRPRYLRMLREAVLTGGGSDLFDRAMETGEGEARAKAHADLQRECWEYARGLFKDLK